MRIMLALAVVLGSACGGGGGEDLPDDLDVIAATPAAGMIDGMAFSLGSRSMNVSGEDLFVDLLPSAVPDCTIDETDDAYPYIIFFVPAVAGRYELGDGRTVTFVNEPSSNLIVGHGVIEIESIDANTVSGGLHVFDSEFGEVNGRFDGPVCFSS